MRTHAICLALAIVLTCPSASAQWVQQNSGTGAWLFGVSIVNPNSGWVVGIDLDSIVVLRTSNSGATWTSQTVGVPHSFYLNAVSFTDASTGIAVGGVRWAGTGAYGAEKGAVLRTTDGGTSWGIVSSDSTDYLTSIEFRDAANGWAVGGNKYAAWKQGLRSSAVILHTSDGGTTWIIQYAESLTGDDIQFRSVSFADTENGTVVGGRRILRTTNGGATWTRQATWTDTTLFSFSRVCFANSNSGLIFGQERDVPILLRTTDAGETWSSKQFSAYVYDATFVDANIGIAVGDSGKILRTTDGGTTWTNQLSGTTNSLYCVSFADANTGTVVGDNGTILHTTNGGVTSAEGEQQVPSQFTLSQNYPNPFNPSTTIKFELPQSAIVRLSVYDMLGREVSVLVNERRNAGVHEVKFDGSHLASGVYFYRLTAGDFVQTKKLVLVK